VLLYNTYNNTITEWLREAKDFCEFRGNKLVITEEGIHLIDENVFNESYFKTVLIDMGAVVYTTDLIVYRFPSNYLTFEISDYDYSNITASYEIPDNYIKIDLGRGHKGKYFQITCKSSDSEELLIDEIGLEVKKYEQN